jgi:hypothetical protein
MMSVVYNGRDGRRSGRASSWNEASQRVDDSALDDGNRPETAESASRLYPMDVSLREQQLLLRLRMLGAGEYVVMVSKDQRGMIGLKEWNVEDIP